jgi:hypothetical protein
MLIFVKGLVAVASGVAFVILMIMFPLLLRAIMAKLRGSVPPNVAIVRGPGGPLDAITWFITYYVGALSGAVCVGWLVAAPILPPNLACPAKGGALCLLLSVSGVVAVFGTLFVMSHCADIDLLLKRHGA